MVINTIERQIITEVKEILADVDYDCIGIFPEITEIGNNYPCYTIRFNGETEYTYNLHSQESTILLDILVITNDVVDILVTQTGIEETIRQKITTNLSLNNIIMTTNLTNIDRGSSLETNENLAFDRAGYFEGVNISVMSFEIGVRKVR